MPSVSMWMLIASDITYRNHRPCLSAAIGVADVGLIAAPHFFPTFRKASYDLGLDSILYGSAFEPPVYIQIASNGQGESAFDVLSETNISTRTAHEPSTWTHSVTNFEEVPSQVRPSEAWTDVQRPSDPLGGVSQDGAHNLLSFIAGFGIFLRNRLLTTYSSFRDSMLTAGTDLYEEIAFQLMGYRDGRAAIPGTHGAFVRYPWFVRGDILLILAIFVAYLMGHTLLHFWPRNKLAHFVGVVAVSLLFTRWLAEYSIEFRHFFASWIGFIMGMLCKDLLDHIFSTALYGAEDIWGAIRDGSFLPTVWFGLQDILQVFDPIPFFVPQPLDAESVIGNDEATATAGMAQDRSTQVTSHKDEQINTNNTVAATNEHPNVDRIIMDITASQDEQKPPEDGSTEESKTIVLDAAAALEQCEESDGSASTQDRLPGWHAGDEVETRMSTEIGAELAS